MLPKANKRGNRLKPTPREWPYQRAATIYLAMKPRQYTRVRDDADFSPPVCVPKANGSRVCVYRSYGNALYACDRAHGGYVVTLDLTTLPRAADDRVSINEDEDGHPIDEPEHVSHATSDLEFAERQFTAWAEIVERLRTAI